MQESTIRTMMQFLKVALQWAVTQKFLPECPAFPEVRPPGKAPRPVPVESVERLLTKVPDDNMRVFLLSAWLAGLRLSEALALEWEETEKAPYLDLNGERIVFPAEFVKGKKDQWVPLDRELRESILSLPKQGRKVFCFLSRRGHQRILSPSRISDSIRKLARKAGVKMTMKTLRSGFGCFWASRVPAPVLQRLMRHGSITTTMKYYVNVDDAAMAVILNRPRNILRNSDDVAQQDGVEKQAASESRKGR